MAEQPKPGSIVHVEFNVKDPKPLKKFYSDLFGWKFQDVPQMNYSTFEAPSGPGGGIGVVQKGQEAGITNYILVNSVDEYITKVTKAGGKVLGPKTEVPGWGWMAWFQDPAGMKLALWQPSPQAMAQRR